MVRTIDTRGFSCPQPVLMTLKEIQTLGRGEVVILVDTDTSRENVIRAAKNKGWKIKEVKAEGNEYQVTIRKD
ncbi:MAG: sulfurtransferase TusA family protein [Pseudomonadota bacterium]